MNSGKVIFEENAEKYFMPASNMKNFTVAAALEKLTPNFRFVTSVFAPTAPDTNGSIKGDLRIVGRGDVSFSTSFTNGDYFKGLDDLAARIAAAGIKRIEGDLVGDESYFTGSPIPFGWEWDDLQWDYGAEVSALPLNDNALDLIVSPGPVGYQCSVRMLPFNPVMRVVNRCNTTPAGTVKTLRIEKKLDQNILEISGDLPARDVGFKGSVTISRPAELFVALLKQRLEMKGVTITGTARTTRVPIQDRQRSIGSDAGGSPAFQTKFESPPLSVIAARTMKPSQNMYTETLLWTLGEQTLRRTADGKTIGDTAGGPDSSSLGIIAVKMFLTEIGVPADGIIQHDGSGLSRHNLVTPSAVVRLYQYMAKQSRFSQAWRESLTVGGIDGTLRNRFIGTKASGNVRGKTGTIDQVSALSGYVTTAAGEQLVFSIIVNGVAEPRVRTTLIDDIAVSLANFDGKIDEK